MKPFFDSSILLADPEALRARFNQDGYLYLPNLLDTQPLVELRRQIADICAQCNWFKPGTDPMDAISWTIPKVEGEEEYFEVYDQIQRLQDFHALPHLPAMMEVMRALLGKSAFPHPLSIARLVFPDNANWSTPPHQDFFNNQGTPELYAGWIPLSDCPMSMGSLAILEGSHKLGELPMEFALGAGYRRTALTKECESLSWASNNFNLGDVLIFHSLTVHRALNNQTDGMRFSVDYRYQAEKQDICENCLVSHFDRQSWHSIYEGWSRDELKYYWKDKDLNIHPWDTELGRLTDDHIASAVKLQKGYNRGRQKLAEKYDELGSRDSS